MGKTGLTFCQNNLYFLIVNYYSTAFIRKLLASLDFSERSQFHVAIVNNSPEDFAVKDLATEYSNIQLIFSEENLGFGRGCNLGLQTIYQQNSNALIWLINPDTTVEQNAIDFVIECFHKHPDLAILGTQIRDSQGNLWFSQGQFNRWTGSLKHTQPLAIAKLDNPGEVLPSRWVSGCSLILNLAKFETCPLFDPHYFLYYEDNDFCERYYQQGYQISVTQAILVNHVVSATSQNNVSAKFRHATYSKLYFLQQHGTRLSLILNIIYMGLKTIISLRQDRAIAIGRWQGLKQFFLTRQHGE
ncbi:MAG: glycosyltransferase family 2 protein [Desertifilum sp. SIO1I2]|nr:glycosyltransferase family 2 protein [Desertifilum sp. SIO1I2]